MGSAHQTALESKHRLIERQIAEEGGRPCPDQARIALLKRQKLKVKEALLLG